MEEKRVNVKDVLAAMDNVHVKSVYPVFVPSLKKSVMFREMTTGQEKAVVKTIIDNPVYNSEFIFTIRQIIKENCAEELDIDQLTIVDKTAICLVMRQKSIGDEFIFTFKGTNKKQPIKISTFIDKFKNVTIPEEKTVEDDNYIVVCKPPTILDEYELEHEFHSNSENINIESVKDMKDAIGEVFINEVIKYIKSITIKGENPMYIDLSEFNYKTRISILEKFGNKLLAKILEYIGDVNKEYNAALAVELELTEKEQEETGESKLTGILEAGSDFFITS